MNHLQDIYLHKACIKSWNKILVKITARLKKNSCLVNKSFLLFNHIMTSTFSGNPTLPQTQSSNDGIEVGVS